MKLRHEDVFELAAQIYTERTQTRPICPVLHCAVNELIVRIATRDGAAILAERVADVRAEVIQLQEEGLEPHVHPDTFMIIDAVKEAIRRLLVPLN